MTLDAGIQAVGLAAVGLVCFLFGYGFAHERLPGRTGFSATKFNRWYHHFYLGLNWPLRNVVFLWRPFGLLLLLGALVEVVPPAPAVSPSTDRGQVVIWLVLYATLTLLALALLVLSVVALVRPPQWLKPAWLREEEKRLSDGLPSLVPPPPEGNQPPSGRRDVVLVCAISVIIVAGVAILGWPPALLITVGASLPMVVRPS